MIREKMTMIALSLILVAAVTVSADAQRKCGWERGEGIFLEKMETLELSDEQESKLQDMRFSEQKKMINLRAELEKAELDLRRLLDTDASQTDVNKQVELVASKRAAIQKARFDSRFKTKNILTDEQWSSWKEMRGEFRREGMRSSMRGFQQGMKRDGRRR